MVRHVRTTDPRGSLSSAIQAAGAAGWEPQPEPGEDHGGVEHLNGSRLRAGDSGVRDNAERSQKKNRIIGRRRKKAVGLRLLSGRTLRFQRV